MSKLSPWSPRILSVLRIMTAALVIEHATMKFFAFPAAIPGLNGSLPPLILTAGLIELVAGLLIALGLFTRPAAFLASGTMAAAYFIGHAPQGLWPVLNQGEAPIMFCFVCLYLTFAGAGSWSLDALLGARRPQSSLTATA